MKKILLILILLINANNFASAAGAGTSSQANQMVQQTLEAKIAKCLGEASGISALNQLMDKINIDANIDNLPENLQSEAIKLVEELYEKQNSLNNTNPDNNIHLSKKDIAEVITKIFELQKDSVFKKLIQKYSEKIDHLFDAPGSLSISVNLQRALLAEAIYNQLNNDQRKTIKDILEKTSKNTLDFINNYLAKDPSTSPALKAIKDLIQDLLSDYNNYGKQNSVLKTINGYDNYMTQLSKIKEKIESLLKKSEDDDDFVAADA